MEFIVPLIAATTSATLFALASREDGRATEAVREDYMPVQLTRSAAPVYATTPGARIQYFNAPMSNLPMGVSNTIQAGILPPSAVIGEVSNVDPVVYDRQIFMTRNTRLRAMGDQIRGDLRIRPIQSDWFRPSANMIEDLQPGALNIIGGIDISAASNTVQNEAWTQRLQRV